MVYEGYSFLCKQMKVYYFLYPKRKGKNSESFKVNHQKGLTQFIENKTF